jgi:hypothetical protein
MPNIKFHYILLKVLLRVVVAGLLLPSNPGLAADQIVIGKAFNQKGELEYIEHHRLLIDGGRIVATRTVFLDAGFQKIGELVSEFSHGPQFGSYEFTDSRAQYLDGAKVTADRITLYCRRTPGGDMETKSLPIKADQIVGQGFNQFIVTRLDALTRGEEFRMKLVLPSKLDQYDVCIRKSKIEGGVLHIRVEMANWFLKLFAPHMDAEYDLKTRRLLRYDGISMIEDAGGKNSQVSIAYEYEPDKLLLAKLSKF